MTSSGPRARWALAVAVTAAVAGCADDPPDLGPTRAAEFVLEDPRIDESSGLAPSRVHPEIFYTHNDRGSEPQVFAVSSATGETEAVLDVDAAGVDWEDIEVTDSGVWVGDIGGGESTRTTVSVVTFPEPETLEDGTPDWTEHELSYEDGAHNAEALLVDPTTDRLYVVTKDPLGGSIYAAPKKLGPDRNILRYVAEAPPNVTSGSWAPDGDGFALRNYARAYLYKDLQDAEPRQVELPDSPQGESIVLLENGDLLIGSEGARSKVVEVPVRSDAG